MATLIADLADADAHRIHRRLTSLAAGLKTDLAPAGDARNRDQLRADILVDLLLGADPAPAPPEPRTSVDGREPNRSRARPVALHPTGPARCEVQVIVSLGALLGIRDDPAHIPGLGPIPADVARTLAADGRWTAWITDAAGTTVQSTGTRGYVPNPGLARLVRARHPHCRFPGCRQPATRCDLDHATPWPAGPTTPDNLGPLCRRHHNLKTHLGWTLSPEPHGDDDPGEQPVPATEAGGRTHATPEHFSAVDADPCGALGRPTEAAGWRWRTPAGFTITDNSPPPLPSTFSR